MVAFKNSTGIKANSSFCTFRFPTAEAHQLTKPFQYQPITTTSPTQPFAHFVFMPINASVNITRDLSLLANYAYTHGESRASGVWQPLERTFKHSGTAAVNYNHTWGKYTLNANLNARSQSRTFYPAYEDAPGYSVFNINTSHTFAVNRFFSLVPSIGVDNIFNKVDDRVATTNIRHALYSPGRMLVVGLKINFNN